MYHALLFTQAQNTSLLLVLEIEITVPGSAPHSSSNFPQSKLCVLGRVLSVRSPFPSPLRNFSIPFYRAWIGSILSLIAFAKPSNTHGILFCHTFRLNGSRGVAGLCHIIPYKLKPISSQSMMTSLNTNRCWNPSTTLSLIFSTKLPLFFSTL